jgi:hypothetical protein
MKTQVPMKYRALAALAGAFLVTLLGLGACMNPFQGPAERSPDGSTGIRISIVNGEARTLLPTATFSKYELQFSDDDGVETHSNVILTGTNTGIIDDLNPADWTIKVTAYVQVAGQDVAAAEGSAQVRLAENDLKAVSVRVSSKTNGADGYFSYAIQYPADVYYASLSMYDSSAAEEFSRDLLGQKIEDDIPLAPGYYLLRVFFETNYSMAARTEIVHIYPGMETRWEDTFTGDDFGIPLEISGTVDLREMVEPVDYAEIRLYQDADFTYWEAETSESSPSDFWSWTIRALPFNESTDLYVELRLRFSGGSVLVKRLPAPVSVRAENVSVSMGPFTVKQVNIGGKVDFSKLTALGLTAISSTGVSVYGNGADWLGSAPVDYTGDGSWSLDLVTEESPVPAQIVLFVHTQYGYFCDELQESISGDRSNLNFTPGSISAGTSLAGGGLGYRYLFVPETSGDYAFALSAAGSHNLYLYDAEGNQIANSYGNPDARFSHSLTANSVYYVTISLQPLFQAFQFRVDRLNQASLGGTVEFTDILSHFDGVTVDNAGIAIYDNSLHTQMDAGLIDTSDGSWSATVDIAGSSTPVVFVIGAELSNGRTVYHQEQDTISGDNSSRNFSPAALAGGTVTRLFINNDDYLLFVPPTTGTYSLKASAGADQYMSYELSDAKTGDFLGSYSGPGELEIVQTLTAGDPYLVHANGYGTYRFQVEALQPVNLSGTVDLSGLAPLGSSDIVHVGVNVYTAASNPAYLGSAMVESNGSWLATVPVSGTRAVGIEARIYLKNGHQILAWRQDTISGNTPGLDLAPAAVSLTGGQAVARTSGFFEDQFLFIPSDSGLFNLGAVSDSTPYLAVYDAAAGTTLARSNSGSLYTELAAGIPYVVQVSNIGSVTAYQFQLSQALTSTAIGGSVDYTGLSSVSIASATVSGYLDNSANTQIIFNAPAGSSAWSAAIPSLLDGQSARLVLTMYLNNGLSFNSHIDGLLPASNLNFAPTPVQAGTVINGRNAAEGDDRLLFVPASSGAFTLQAAGDTWITITVFDGLTGSQIAYSGGDATLTESLDAGNPYIIGINGHSFRGYQFRVDPVVSP